MPDKIQIVRPVSVDINKSDIHLQYRDNFIAKRAGDCVHIYGSACIGLLNGEKQYTILVNVDQDCGLIRDDNFPCAAAFPENVSGMNGASQVVVRARPELSQVEANQLKLLVDCTCLGRADTTLHRIGFLATLPTVDTSVP